MIYRFPAARAITTITSTLMMPGRVRGAFVGTGCGDPEGVGTGLAGAVAGVVTGAVVVAGAGVAGTFATRLKVVDPVTSTVIPETVTIYSSGLNAAVST